ncbi:MAG: PRC-barrel domain-containing protein [Hyphomicrobiaceae bacterium]
MRQILYGAAIALLMAPGATGAAAQTAGETQLGVTTLELKDVIKGWSARRQLLGEDVYNDQGEKIGEIEDLIVTPERNVSYAIVSSGGFLGMGSHDVAIPAKQFKMGDKGRLTLPGATKEKLRAMPTFEYTRR